MTLELDIFNGEKRLLPAYGFSRRELLSEAEKRVYDEVCIAASRRQNSAVIRNADSVDWSSVVNAIWADQPMLYYLGKGMSISSFSGQQQVSWESSYTPQEIDRYDKMIGRALRALPIASEGSALKREIHIHDLLQRMKFTESGETPEDHTIIGPLLYRHCVCEGCAKLFVLLCRLCHLPCIVVTGIGHTSDGSEEHAWNMVRLESGYVHVDAYWDQRLRNKRAGYCYDYLNLTDRQIGADHEWTLSVPACTGSGFSFFAFRNADIRNMAEYRDYVYRCIRSGKKVITARMQPGYDLHACLETVKSIWLETINQAPPYGVAKTLVSGS